MSRQVRSDWASARARVPYASNGNWALILEDNPEVLHRIIADAYDVVLREEERAAGVRRSGRRPKPSLVPLGDVVDKVFPQQYSHDPFPVALANLLEGHSQRAFAKRVPCHQATLSKLLNGQYEPDLPMMERIAEAAGEGPWYFLEWRAGYVGALVTDALTTSPSTAVQVIRGMRLLARGGELNGRHR